MLESKAVDVELEAEDKRKVINTVESSGKLRQNNKMIMICISSHFPCIQCCLNHA